MQNILHTIIMQPTPWLSFGDQPAQEGAGAHQIAFNSVNGSRPAITLARHACQTPPLSAPVAAGMASSLERLRQLRSRCPQLPARSMHGQQQQQPAVWRLQ